MANPTGSVKGHLTKLRKANHGNSQATHAAIREYFGRSMPAQQAKHATRKYLASV